MILVGGQTCRSAACFTVSEQKKTCKLTRMTSLRSSSSKGSVMSASALVRVAKGAGNVVHTERPDDTGVTSCGRRFETYGPNSASGWHRVMADNEYLYGGPCMACLNYTSRRPATSDSERWIREAAAPVVTRQYVTDTDTYTLIVDGASVGTVDSTRDRTGDRLARSSHGEIVAPRFSDTSNAEAYLIARHEAFDQRATSNEVTRPTLCPVSGAGAHGGCIREAGHYGEHVATDHRWTDEDDARIIRSRQAARAEAIARDLPAFDHGAETIRARAASMAAHPAGKGRRGQAYADPITGDAVYRVVNAKPVPVSVASILALLDSSPWDARPVASILDGQRNRYDATPTYRHQG